MAAPPTAACSSNGENGTGKELVARSIHALSRRRPGPSWKSTAPPSPLRYKADSHQNRKARKWHRWGIQMRTR